MILVLVALAAVVVVTSVTRAPSAPLTWRVIAIAAAVNTLVAFSLPSTAATDSARAIVHALAIAQAILGTMLAAALLVRAPARRRGQVIPASFAVIVAALPALVYGIYAVIYSRQ